jgi:hypothetical protein
VSLSLWYPGGSSRVNVAAFTMDTAYVLTKWGLYRCRCSLFKTVLKKRRTTTTAHAMINTCRDDFARPEAGGHLCIILYWHDWRGRLVPDAAKLYPSKAPDLPASQSGRPNERRKAVRSTTQSRSVPSSKAFVTPVEPVLLLLDEHAACLEVSGISDQLNFRHFEVQEVLPLQ